jgi:hypothetical protein
MYAIALLCASLQEMADNVLDACVIILCNVYMGIIGFELVPQMTLTVLPECSNLEIESTCCIPFVLSLVYW